MAKEPTKKAVNSGIPKRLEMEYDRAIRKAVARVLPPRGSTPDLQKWIEHILMETQGEDFQRLAWRMAQRMVRWVNTKSAKNWREAAARSQRSRMLYRLLQKEMQGPVGRAVRGLIAENAVLIRSIPYDVSKMLTHEIMRLQQGGARPETIAKAMRMRLPELTRNKIRLIARTETMKASAALTEARATNLGLPLFIWRTSEDSRVRRSHRNLDGILVAFADPPQPEKLIGEKTTLNKGIPGTFPNCRCVILPVLDFDDIAWPAKMYLNGKIRNVTRSECKRMFPDFANRRN